MRQDNEQEVISWKYAWNLGSVEGVQPINTGMQGLWWHTSTVSRQLYLVLKLSSVLRSLTSTKVRRQPYLVFSSVLSLLHATLLQLAPVIRWKTQSFLHSWKTFKTPSWENLYGWWISITMTDIMMYLVVYKETYQNGYLCYQYNNM